MAARYADPLDRLKPGRASRVIRPFTEIRPGDLVLVACRVSGCEQNRRGNLTDHEEFLRREVQAVGATVVGSYSWVGSGFDPWWLIPAIHQARDLGATVIVALTTDRLVRHPAFHSKLAPDLQAREHELEMLADVAGGLRLVTFLDPDATPKEVRSFRTSFGQSAKGNRGGGRERKKNLRKRLKPKAVELRRQGLSLRRISKELGVPFRTVGRWVKQGVPF